MFTSQVQEWTWHDQAVEQGVAPTFCENVRKPPPLGPRPAENPTRSGGKGARTWLFWKKAAHWSPHSASVWEAASCPGIKAASASVGLARVRRGKASRCLDGSEEDAGQGQGGFAGGLSPARPPVPAPTWPHSFLCQLLSRRGNWKTCSLQLCPHDAAAPPAETRPVAAHKRVPDAPQHRRPGRSSTAGARAAPRAFPVLYRVRLVHSRSHSLNPAAVSRQPNARSACLQQIQEACSPSSTGPGSPSSDPYPTKTQPSVPQSPNFACRRQ